MQKNPYPPDAVQGEKRLERGPMLLIKRILFHSGIFLLLRFLSWFLFWGSRPEVSELLYAWIQYPAFIGQVLFLAWIAIKGASDNPRINPVFFTLFAGWMIGVVYLVLLDAGGFLFLIFLMGLAVYYSRNVKPIQSIQFLYILIFLSILFALRQLQIIPGMIWFA